MSRNEMFFLLACAAVAAVMSTDPVSSRQAPVNIINLLTPAPDIVAWNQTDLTNRDVNQP